MANDTDVKIVAIKPQRSEKAEQASDVYTELPIDIEATSGYHQLGYFINRLENADRFMKIKNLRIEASDDDVLKHDISLVVSAFVLTGEKK